MRPSLRFEVFKRDGFTCQYCGRKTPDVVLEADHVIPVAQGGGDEIENLVTACWDCNRGKGAESLDARAPVRDIVETTDAIREREAQLRAFHEAGESLREYEEARLNQARNHWFTAFGETELRKSEVPRHGDFKRWVSVLGVPETMDAIEITSDKFPHGPSWDAVRYFIGVCRSKEAGSEGRKFSCPECNDWLIITREQQAEAPDAKWMHGACLEKQRERQDAEREAEVAAYYAEKEREERERRRLEDLARERAYAEVGEMSDIELEVAAWDRMAESSGF